MIPLSISLFLKVSRIQKVGSINNRNWPSLIGVNLQVVRQFEPSIYDKCQREK